MLTAFRYSDIRLQKVALILLISSFTFCLCFAMCDFKINKKRKYLGIFSTLLAIISGQAGGCLSVYLKMGKTISDTLCGLPIAVYLLYPCAVLLYCLIRILRINRFMKENFSVNSVKEGMDMLPIGICLYTPNGTIHLINHEMERLSIMMTGHSGMNGEELWGNFNGKNNCVECETIRIQELTMIRMPDKSIWYCEKSETSDGRFQLCAYEYSDKYMMLRELSENNEKYMHLNDRLKKYGESVDEAVRQEEYLATKIRIHDSLGRILISAMAYVNGAGGDRERILNGWNRSLSLILGETSAEEKSNDLEKELINAAEFLGITLSVHGDFPQNGPAQRLLLAGARECMTNASRHAKAKKLEVFVEKTGAETKIIFTNDGEPPKGEVTEAGGLVSLRKLTESEGATMEVKSSPIFCLTITVRNLEEEQKYGH